MAARTAATSHTMTGGVLVAYVSPDDVVIGVLRLAWGPKESRTITKFTPDRADIHSIFYELKKEYPSVFSCFVFRNRGLFYESEQLDQALANLERAGVLHRHNEVPRYYEIQDYLDSAYNEFAGSYLNQGGINESAIQLAAARFAEMVEHEVDN
jgi:hypothetical protein